MSTFAVDIASWCEKAQLRGDQVLRTVTLELFSRIVLRSPVGNPELWASNQSKREDRVTFNQLRVLSGKKELKQRTLAKKFPLTAGKGYTGGRFRGSWQVSIGAPSTGAPKRIDPGGSTTIAAGNTVIAEAHLGTVIYAMSNLPYSERLEFGWSKQAPAGCVRITAAEFLGVVEDVVRALPP